MQIANWRSVDGPDGAAAAEELGLRYLEVGPDTPAERLQELRAAGFGLVLRIGEPESQRLEEWIAALPSQQIEPFEAAGWRFTESGGGDPVALNGPARTMIEAFKRAPQPLPAWLSALRLGEDDDAPARGVKLAAHALALGIPRVFLGPPWNSPVLEPALRAYSLLIGQLEEATRISPTAPGQYRIEIPGRNNRYLLWADPAIRRLPSSLQGPLRVTDLTGEGRRIEATRLKLTPQPVFVDRE